MDFMLETIWPIALHGFVFLLGAAVGSFLNVCIYRLPYEKSVLWPGSRCGHCFQPIRLYNNIPLVSYWLLRGRCRSCGTRFAVRYFFVELLTGLCFLGLFHLEVVANIHDWKVLKDRKIYIDLGLIPYEGWVLFGYHAVLLCFLLVASFIDIDHQEIPLSVTVAGTVVGLIGSVLWPWPWPLAPDKAVPPPAPPGPLQTLLPQAPKGGLYPWPVWYPLPDWLAPGGNWQTGLATGLAGMLAGMMVLRAVSFLFQAGRGKEGLGLGDADFMMMAGSFLGWQPVVVAFFIAVFPGLILGVGQLILRGNQMLPFGPALALGIMITLLGWRWIGPACQALLFNGPALLVLGAMGGGFLLLTSWLLRFLRRD
jgi:leader peptidase (prepilin peptidase)/N-methyltransferase